MNKLSSNYISTQQAAAQWNISRRRVLVLCQEERIPNIMRVGNMWLIPGNAIKPEDNRHFRYIYSSPNAKPFLKWAGGKTQLLEDISAIIKKLPDIKKYAEPFVGGGALLFNMLTSHDLEQVYISDVNPELVNVYTNVKNNVQQLIDKLEKIEKEFLKKDLENRKSFYLSQRQKFNNIKLNGKTAELEKAVLFIFLNKTCFNGLYRVNRKGEFNVPIGSYLNLQICDKDNLLSVSKLLQNVEIVCGDYKESAKFIDKNTFVYFDPPYRPLSETSSFTSYTASSFNDANQKELAEYVSHLSENGAKILISNSDPKNYNPKDTFFDKLYSKYNIKRVLASRMINCNGKSRGQLTELLISNF
jgi:DNA adenine methylase